jgi:DNA polymerase-3 subunit delta
MIYLLYVEDDFTAEEFLTALRDKNEPADLRDLNETTLDGASVGFEELAHACATVPFLAERRMVIVRRLLSRFERRSPQRGRERGDGQRANKLGEWEALPDYLAAMPESTDLVFVDGRLSPSNPLLSAVRPKATTHTFPPLSPDNTRRWISSRTEARGARIEPKAVDALVRVIGSDLRVLAGEIEKLSLYCLGRAITQEDVEEMVSYTKEANIFLAVDAMVEGRAAVAVRLTRALLQSGRPAAYILSMVARQVRLLILAKDLRAQRVPAGEHGRRLGLSGYPLRKTLEQERRLSAQGLVDVHRLLLEADLSTKSLGVSEDVVLDTLIAEVSSTLARR